MITDIISQLKRDEGFRASPYLDTRGIPTVGYGRNLAANPLPNETYPLSEQRASEILQYDLARIWGTLQLHLPWVATLPEVYSGVLANMSFNMGVNGLLGFKNMLGAVQHGQYDDAALDMQESAWFHQVGARAQRLVKQMELGIWQ